VGAASSKLTLTVNPFLLVHDGKRVEETMGSVLIVDDDQLIRTLVADFLTSEGYQCTQADGVAEACRHLQQQPFELAISDFNMPRETGLDLLRYVASNFPSMHFIMMSGSPGAQLRAEALALGAAAFVAKPFKLHELLKEVESGLHRQRHCH
jgi:DNA-binding NtrC family response regulator